MPRKSHQNVSDPGLSDDRHETTATATQVEYLVVSNSVSDPVPSAEAPTPAGATVAAPSVVTRAYTICRRSRSIDDGRYSCGCGGVV